MGDPYVRLEGSLLPCQRRPVPTWTGRSAAQHVPVLTCPVALSWELREEQVPPSFLVYLAGSKEALGELPPLRLSSLVPRNSGSHSRCCEDAPQADAPSWGASSCQTPTTKPWLFFDSAMPLAFRCSMPGPPPPLAERVISECSLRGHESLPRVWCILSTVTCFSQQCNWQDDCPIRG